MRYILFIVLLYPSFMLACSSDLERDIKEGIELRSLEKKYIPRIHSESSNIFIGRVLRIIEREENEKYSAEVAVLETFKGSDKLERIKLVVSTKPDFNEKMINHGKAGCSDLYDKADVYNSIYTFLRPGYKYLLYAKDGNLIRSNLFVESLDYISAEQEALEIRKQK